MKKINQSIIAIFTVFIVFFNCRTLPPNQSITLKEQYWFQEMWFLDTCGQKGYRGALSDFIIHKQEKEEFFKNRKDIVSLLGEPYQEITNDDNTSTIIYVVFSAIDCKTYSFGGITEGIAFSFNKNGGIKRVNKFVY